MRYTEEELTQVYNKIYEDRKDSETFNSGVAIPALDVNYFLSQFGQVSYSDEIELRAWFDMKTAAMCTPFEEWCDEYEDALNIKFAETGADREMDFDLEKDLKAEYDRRMGGR